MPGPIQEPFRGHSLTFAFTWSPLLGIIYVKSPR
jgi:hypothetical protein